MLQDITNTKDFVKGVAHFTHLSTDPKTGLQAWKRTYPMEPWRDKVEVFFPIAGRYYPGLEESRMVRQIPANDPKLREKVAHYLEHGVDNIFPGDEKKSVFDED